MGNSDSAPQGETAGNISSLGNQVRILREAHGWSQTYLANRMTAVGHRWHVSTVSKTETGAGRVVPIEEACDLADIFGVTLDELAGRRAEPEDNLLGALDRIMVARREAVWQLDVLTARLRDAVIGLRRADELMRYAELVSDATDALDALTTAAETMNHVGQRPDAGMRDAMLKLTRGALDREEGKR